MPAEPQSPYSPPTAAVADREEAIGGERPQTGSRKSSLGTGDLVDLWFRPAAFYNARVFPDWQVLLFGWLAGFQQFIDRIEVRILQEDLGRRSSGLAALADSWAVFWAAAVVAGALGGWILWYLAGWWYRVRLRWSGISDPDRRLARALWGSSTFVAAAPLFLLTLGETLAYPSYRAARDDPFGVLPVVFLFWSVVTSYAAVRQRFVAKQGLALWWFLVFPMLVFGVITAGVVAFSLFAGR
jgi:hypothetical protein